MNCEDSSYMLPPPSPRIIRDAFSSALVLNASASACHIYVALQVAIVTESRPKDAGFTDCLCDPSIRRWGPFERLYRYQ